MDHGMGWVLLTHIGLPLLFGMAFLVFSFAASSGPSTWVLALETALDLAILSIGATGAIFENPKLIAAFGPENAQVGLAVVGINLLLSSIILVLKRKSSDGRAPVGPAVGCTALFLGALTIAVVTSVLAWGYKNGQQPNSPSAATIGQTEKSR